MMDEHYYLGLDLETTSSSSEGLMIQLGMATEHLRVFCQDITYNLKTLARAHVDPQALEVNNFTLDRITGVREDEGNGLVFHRNTETFVQQQAQDWLMDEFPLDPNLEEAKVRTDDLYGRKFVAIGWNVAGFDMPFVKRQMNRLAGWFHYRTIDLNAPCYTVARAWGLDHKELKERIKSEADERIVAGKLYDGERHDAGYDALAAVLEWKALCELIGAGRGALQT